MKEIILASMSPRRKEILELIGIPFQVVVSHVEEKIADLPPVEVVQDLARQKAEAVAAEYPDAVVVGADTIVVVDDMILGKPADRADAERMIRMIQGRSHEVYTGVAICDVQGAYTFAEQTKVYIREMEDAEIQEYLDTEEPYDKAGAYAVQGRFARYISKLEGDYYNVMGLPACQIYTELKEKGFMN